jgi:4-hydroxy-tetrahydrodipicolinate synthase
VVHAPPSDIVDFYGAVAAAADPLPVWIQDFVAPVGTPMAIETLVRIFENVPGVRHIKEETLLAPQVMTALRDRLGERISGLMGGMAGRYMLEEYRRGATGTMPACEVTDVHVAIWNMLDAGDADGARDLHTALLPLLNYEAMFGYTIYKEVLRRRGVIASGKTRVPGAGYLDRENHRELDRLLDRLSPHFRV